MTIDDILYVVCIYIIVIIGVVGLLIVVGGTLSDYYQKYRFNNGICRDCGSRLHSFDDVCAPSCKGFECSKCNYTTYVSYSNMLVDKHIFTL